jgi:hypothetical protein
VGLFGSTKTYVASTLYNLAGAEEDRKSYLKSLVTANVIGNSKFSISETLQRGYLNGPGMQMRRFFRWANNTDEYDLIGVPTGNLGGTSGINLEDVKDSIPHDVDQDVKITVARVGSADYSYWAEQWMMDNEPTLLNTDWTSDIDEATNEITITFEDTTTQSFTPTDFDSTGRYLYVTYNIVDLNIEGGSSEGPIIDVWPGGFPDPGSSVLVDFFTTPYEGGEIWTWVRETVNYIGDDTEFDAVYSTIIQRHEREFRDPVGVAYDREYQNYNFITFDVMWSQAKMWIYRLGDGNLDIDFYIIGEVGEGEFFPFIPIRLNNQFLSDTYQADAFAQAKKALKRTGASYSFDDLVDKLSESEDLAEFDYAYVMYGVPLNVTEDASKEYLYRFWDKCRDIQVIPSGDYETWEDEKAAFDAQVAAWNEWRLAQADSGDPLFGTDPPAIFVSPSKPLNYIHITSSGTIPSNVNIKISWTQIYETTGVGEGFPGANPGELHLEDITSSGIPDSFYNEGSFEDIPEEDRTSFTITWQTGANAWTRLTVHGAVHENKIYKNKSVRINAADALADTEESGFLVPLHYQTVKDMSLVRSTQMHTACAYMVINTYQEVKTGFFGSAFFKIFLFVVVIAVSVLTFGTGTAPSIGILGSAASIGSALGFSGIVAIIVGTIANAVAAMIVMRIIQAGATELFGAEFGALIGAIASVVAITVGTGLMNGQSLSAVWGNMMSAQNLMNLTNAVGSGVQGYMQASAANFAQKTQDLVEDFQKQSQDLTQRFLDEFGMRGTIDPMLLTDSPFGGMFESEQMFLSRTLLTGTDIAEMSMDMLTNFANYTVTTKLPSNT